MDLLARIEQLERRNSRTIWLLLGAFAIALVCIGAAQNTRPKPSDSVETKSLRIFDDNGNLRGFIAASPRGNVALTLVDQKGKVCAVLGVTSDACPSLELSHSDKTLRARLTLAPDGNPVLEFYDAEGKVTEHLP